MVRISVIFPFSGNYRRHFITLFFFLVFKVNYLLIGIIDVLIGAIIAMNFAAVVAAVAAVPSISAIVAACPSAAYIVDVIILVFSPKRALRLTG